MNLSELGRLSFSVIKEEILKMTYEEITDELIEVLKADSRKNVSYLGTRILNNKEKHASEILRVKGIYDFDRSFNTFAVISGVDEVGRGPLAGPIVAAAVILELNPDEKIIFGINDSKKLSEIKRKELSEIIKEKAIAYNIAMLDNSVIDEKGIAWCNNDVLRRAADGLRLKQDLVLSDGYAVKGLSTENKFFHKGDSKSASIAAASIIAKVFRDDLMKEYDTEYKVYNFKSNVGYGSEEHISAIKYYGPCPIHRMSFLKNIL